MISGINRRGNTYEAYWNSNCPACGFLTFDNFEVLCWLCTKDIYVDANSLSLLRWTCVMLLSCLVLNMVGLTLPGSDGRIGRLSVRDNATIR